METFLESRAETGASSPHPAATKAARSNSGLKTHLKPRIDPTYESGTSSLLRTTAFRRTISACARKSSGSLSPARRELSAYQNAGLPSVRAPYRSEERRVGKECRAVGSAEC